MKLFFTFLSVTVLLLSGCSQTPGTSGPLKVSAENPRYFADVHGNIVYLSGAHNWNVLIEDVNHRLDYVEYLDYLKRNELNFIRLWANLGLVWSRSDTLDEHSQYYIPTVYERTGPGIATDGKLRFDLTQINPQYLNKLTSLIEEARKRGIYVSVMLFEGWWISSQKVTDDTWYGHPYNPLNNSNRIQISPLTLHTLSDPEVLLLQEKYVQKIIETVNKYDNVLLEISNEDRFSTHEWQVHMMDFIRSRESEMPLHHPVWLTSQAWGSTDTWLWESNSEVISPSRLLSWDRRAEEPYLLDPPPTNGSKVVILDSDHFLGSEIIYDWRRWVWKAFLRGYNLAIMDPYTTNPEWVLEPKLVESTGYANTWAQKIDLAHMIPSDRSDDCSTRYSMRNPGKEYLFYQPEHNSFTAEVTGGTYTYEWYDPSTGQIVKKGQFRFLSGPQVFSLPESIPDDALLYLRRKKSLF